MLFILGIVACSFSLLHHEENPLLDKDVRKPLLDKGVDKGLQL